MAIVKNMLELIGHTPLFAPQTLGLELPGRLLLKCESFNPGSSIKDRAALSMIEDAEKRGKIKPGTVIIEPTSGNTGIGLAIVCAVRRYRLILTMPESMSIERRQLLAAYGAELVLTDASAGMSGAVAKAEQLAAEFSSAFIPNQFANEANSLAHYHGTALELLSDCPAGIAALIAGVGSGGTISGCGQKLKEINPQTKIIAVEPSDSPLLSQGHAGSHQIQGIGANFVPAILKQELIDEIITATTEQSFTAARKLAKSEGMLIGISGGAALHAGLLVAARSQFAGKNIVVILPDTGERYLSTPLFSK
ncbi:MAG: cysteine synthase A [Clostridiales bacterium]